MTVVSTNEAKDQLAELLRRVEAGEDIVIARDGKPVARLVPLPDAPASRAPKFGTLRGHITLLPGWDDPMTEEELADWYGPELPELEPPAQ